MKSLFTKMTVKGRIILIFFVTSVTLVTMLMLSFIYIEVENTYDRYEQLSRQTANGLSYMPNLINAVNEEDTAEIEGIVERTRLGTENPYITIVDRDGKYVFHHAEDMIGKRGDKEIYTPMLLFGAYDTGISERDENREVRTIAPLFEETGGGERVVGAITVSYLESDIFNLILDKVVRLSFMALIGILISIGGGIWLQRSIRSDTLGYEPSKIAQMFKERNAIISSVREGIIMMDAEGNLTMVNPAAKNIFSNDMEDKEKVKAFELGKVLRTGVPQYDYEAVIDGKTFISNCLPIFDEDQVIGVICSFRDKTDIKQLQETIYQITTYSDDLRAQSHEFKNKLHVLLGLIQVGKYDEAVDFINEEEKRDRSVSPTLDNIKDAGVHAILVGKIAKAYEKRINVIVDKNSRLDETDIAVSDMATMLGNLIDNAIDALVMSNADNKWIDILVTDVGEEIIIDIEDNGAGMSKETMEDIMKSGFSSKGKNRGYGLANVERMAEKYGGFLTFHSEKGEGSVFSLYLPKKKGNDL